MVRMDLKKKNQSIILVFRFIHMFLLYNNSGSTTSIFIGFRIYLNYPRIRSTHISISSISAASQASTRGNKSTRRGNRGAPSSSSTSFPSGCKCGGNIKLK